MADRQKHSDMLKEKVVLWQLRLDGHIDDFEEAFDRFSDETEDVATGFCTGVLSDFYRFNCRFAVLLVKLMSFHLVPLQGDRSCRVPCDHPNVTVDELG